MTRRCFFHVTMNTNQSLNSRGSHIAWVDFLRILACFLVVLAHCCDPFVGSFDGSFNFKSAVFWGSLVRPCVPLFAMISGVLLFPVTLEMGAFYSRRLKRVLVPLIVWSLALPLLYFGYRRSNGQPQYRDGHLYMERHRRQAVYLLLQLQL